MTFLVSACPQVTKIEKRHTGNKRGNCCLLSWGLWTQCPLWASSQSWEVGDEVSLFLKMRKPKLRRSDNLPKVTELPSGLPGLGTQPCPASAVLFVSALPLWCCPHSHCWKWLILRRPAWLFLFWDEAGFCDQQLKVSDSWFLSIALIAISQCDIDIWK